MGIFSALLTLCAGNSPVTGEFPAQMPVTLGFDICYDLCLNKRLSKQWWGWWFETRSHPLWRHCNEICVTENVKDLTLPMYVMSSTTTSQVLHPGRGVLVEICFSSNAKPIKFYAQTYIGLLLLIYYESTYFAPTIMIRLALRNRWCIQYQILRALQIRV